MVFKGRALNFAQGIYFNSWDLWRTFHCWSHAARIELSQDCLGATPPTEGLAERSRTAWPCKRHIQEPQRGSVHHCIHLAHQPSLISHLHICHQFTQVGVLLNPHLLMILLS